MLFQELRVAVHADSMLTFIVYFYRIRTAPEPIGVTFDNINFRTLWVLVIHKSQWSCIGIALNVRLGMIILALKSMFQGSLFLSFLPSSPRV